MENHAYLPTAPRQTQVVAAERIYPRTGTQRGKVLRQIEMSAAGLTDEEISKLLGLSLNSVRPRRLELVEAGFVEDSGNRRLTATGNTAIVWSAVDANTFAKPQSQAA